jgi:hypothetical protein
MLLLLLLLLLLLAHCLYLRPVRPDAAVMVAAKDDVYVDMRSVKALQVGGCWGATPRGGGVLRCNTKGRRGGVGGNLTPAGGGGG